MGFVNYNGVMFGNRMSLNLLQQLKSLVPKDKQYLLDINDFLKFWIKGKISKREEKIFYTSLYGNKKIVMRRKSRTIILFALAWHQRRKKSQNWQQRKRQ